MATLPLPSTMGMTNFGSISLGGNSSKTISQGIYSRISVSGNAKLTMSGGIYIILGGGFSVSNTASIAGNGVMIFNAGSEYPSTGGTYGSITLSSTGTYNLSPATSGTYAGVVLFQPPDNTKSVSASANAKGITGTIYAPAAQLSETSSGAVDASLIFDTLTISGNGSVTGANAASSAGLVIASGGTTTTTSPIETAAPLDQATPKPIPITLKLKVRMTDAAGNNVSSLSLPAVSMSMVALDGILVPQATTRSWRAGNLFTKDWRVT